MLSYSSKKVNHLKRRSSITHYFYTELNGQAPISVHVQEFITASAHTHDFYEFEYAIEGRTQTQINDMLYPMGAGDVVFVTPADIHSYNIPAEKKMKTITVHFSPETFPNLCNLTSGVVHCNEELKNAFSLLLQESRTSDELTGYGVKNLLERILILLNRQSSKTVSAGKPTGISSALAYIHKHFKEKITVEALCKACNYSVSSLCRNFKEETGMTVVAYINKQRLSYAERMLRTLDDSIGEICFACGFTSIRQFNRAFRIAYGCTPTEYRAANAGRINTADSFEKI